MSLEAARRLAAQGRLYPSVILHGGDEEGRRETVLGLARALLCDKAPEERPCGTCRHCRRVAWPSRDGAFHPDFHVQERDLKTSTSVEATRQLLKAAQLAPFEARGQVFVVASAESLSAEAANALLKVLEEPHLRAPRHFFLLAPSRLDLLPTLRSRSLALYLGPSEPLSPEEVSEVASHLREAVQAYEETGASVFLLTAAAALGQGAGWDDPRALRPWALAARAVVRVIREEAPAPWRRPLLALAQELLGAPDLRLRGIPKERILEGLVARHLGRLASHRGP